MRTILTNAQVVTEAEVLSNHCVIIENDRITAILPAGELAATDEKITDVHGAYILPGLIDIHSDMIEALIQPRSTAMMDYELGLREAERQLAACGITTIFHSVSMYREGTWDVKEIRKAENVKKLAACINSIQHGQHMINHRFHLRYEIDNLASYDDILEMMSEGLVHLISFMDHSPSQGQYRNLAIYRRHLPSEGKNITDAEFDTLVASEKAKCKVSLEQLAKLSKAAHDAGIAIASHDDDTIEKLEFNRSLGIKISEFPITLEVAQHAHKNGLLTVLGSPNILLGKSHSGNLSAADAVGAGCADILCSDYYPQALISAVFHLSEKLCMPLCDTCRLASLNPAKAVGISEQYGSIAVGKKADLLVVDYSSAKPFIRQTYIDGCCVINAAYANSTKED